MAVKKICANLMREVKIMVVNSSLILVGSILQEFITCEFVIRLLQLEERKSVGMILPMEICDCDLEEYVKENIIR